MPDFTYQPVFVHGGLDDTPMPANAFRVYAHLCRKAKRDHTVTGASFVTIGAACFSHETSNLSAKGRERRAEKAIAWLTTAGLINTNHNSAGNTYTINPFAAWIIPTPTIVKNVHTYPLIIRREYDELPISAAAFRVLMHLVRRIGNNPHCFPSISNIGATCFSDESREPGPEAQANHAKRAIKELTAKNLIQVTYRNRTTSLYSLTPRSAWRLQGDAPDRYATPAQPPATTTTTPTETAPQTTPAPTETTTPPPTGDAPEVTVVEVTKQLSDSALRARESGYAAPATLDAATVTAIQAIVTATIQPMLAEMTTNIIKTLAGQFAIVTAPKQPELKSLTEQLLGDKYGHPNAKVTRARPVDRSRYDARKFNDAGYCPAGEGKTPYEVYREVFNTQLDKDIIEHMHATVKSLSRWRAALQEWKRRGHRPRNIAEQLHVYQHGWKATTQPPTAKETKGNGYDPELARQRAAALAAAQNGNHP